MNDHNQSIMDNLQSPNEQRIAELEEKLRTVCEWAAGVHDECVTCAYIDNDPEDDICHECVSTLKYHKRHPALKIADEVMK